MLQTLRRSTIHLANFTKLGHRQLPRGHLLQWQRNVTDYAAKYADKLGRAAQQ